MRLVYLADSIFPSKRANSVHVAKMCNALSKLSVETHLVCQQGRSPMSFEMLTQEYNLDSKFQLHLIKPFRIVGSLYYFGLSALLRIWKLKPDYVYTRFLAGAVFCSFFYPTILESHGASWRQSRLNRILFRILHYNKLFKGHIVISESLKKALETDWGLGKFLQVLHDAADPVAHNLTLNLPSDCVHVGYVGSLYTGKGLEIVERISPLLKDFKFHIVGGSTDEVEFWKNRIKSSNVQFYGHIENSRLSKYLNSFDVCIMPNQINVMTGKRSNIGEFTSPLKMFEYMAHKKPIIASDLAVLREVLTNEEALFAGADRPDEWIRSLKAMRDPTLRSRLGEAGFHKFKNNFTWLKRAEQVVTYLY